jgi:hypothetical protein
MRKIAVLPVLSLLLLAACSTNPFTTAQTVEQKGDALYGSYVIAKEQGAAILQNAGIDDQVKRPLAEAMVATKPLGDSGQDLLIQYSVIKDQVAQGQTPPERLAIVEREIAGWITNATPVIQNLINAVAGARK